MNRIDKDRERVHDRAVQGKLLYQGPSIDAVATAAGVSKATVSNYLNGKTARLSESTRARIAEVVTQLGYLPMLGARRLSSRDPSGTIGLVVRRDLAEAFSDPYFATVMAGVGQTLRQQGRRSLVIASGTTDHESDTNYLLSMARGIVDGFLLFDITTPDPVLEAFHRHNLAFVAVGQPEEAVDFPWVATDHAKAVGDLVHWLAARGHERIALESGSTTLLLDRHRRRGYALAMASLGLAADPAIPTAVLRTTEAHRSSPAPSGAEVVLLDGFSDREPAAGSWIESPARLVGERAAQLLASRIAGLRPLPELLPARFHPAASVFDRSLT